MERDNLLDDDHPRHPALDVRASTDSAFNAEISEKNQKIVAEVCVKRRARYFFRAWGIQNLVYGTCYLIGAVIAAVITGIYKSYLGTVHLDFIFGNYTHYYPLSWFLVAIPGFAACVSFYVGYDALNDPDPGEEPPPEGKKGAWRNAVRAVFGYRNFLRWTTQAVYGAALMWFIGQVGHVIQFLLLFTVMVAYIIYCIASFKHEKDNYKMATTLDLYAETKDKMYNQMVNSTDKADREDAHEYYLDGRSALDKPLRNMAAFPKASYSRWKVYLLQLLCFAVIWTIITAYYVDWLYAHDHFWEVYVVILLSFTTQANELLLMALRYVRTDNAVTLCIHKPIVYETILSVQQIVLIYTLGIVTLVAAPRGPMHY